jgi:threonylcarbamoyladenosine tRNA methylthiotransferase MtaB
VLEQLRVLEAAGFNEAIVAGVHLGSWGRDFAPARSFADLLRALAGEPGRLLLRLSSIEPMDFTPEIEILVAGSARFAPHLHLPVQHASDNVLRRMRRPYAFDSVRRLFERLRRLIPGAALGTDVIVGFPGESDADFSLLAAWLDESPLSYVHVFPFSPRPGTSAASMGQRVPGHVVRERVAELRARATGLQRRFRESQAGLTLDALTLGDVTTALTSNYLRVRIPPGRSRNERLRLRVVSADPLRGTVV